jgi:hypothetical protein
MNIFGCPSCGRVFHVTGNDDVVRRLLGRSEWRESVPCPTDLCKGRAMRGYTGCPNYVEMRLEDFYRAIQGQGSAPEKRVRELLSSCKIVDADVEAVGSPERTIVHCLTFADGTKLHFGVSRLGACAHRIEEPPNDVHTAPAAEVSHPGGEEAGRDSTAVEASVRSKSGVGDGPIHGASESTGAGAMPSVQYPGEVPTRQSGRST